ncbi:Putative FMN-binding split barrel [Colletotrichum destructivum]|uniref:FMN-binding split barrel n=1 Tax=Colletotrichum destructivum TaxID=34406 RepID=A0AAX4IRN7_9PEZI|nr:Putative FMN-binding split barrel [Colletotrichum destructivum]
MSAVRNLTSRRISQLSHHLATSSPRAMSSAPGSASPGPAPWRAAFLENVTAMASPEFSLATLHSAPSTAAAGAGAGAVPRLRTVIFRGLWASLPVNPKNTADLNPPAYESDLLTLTTDARMAKVPDLIGGSSASPSGSGGPVEACFWTDAKVQWRVRGEAYVLGPDVEREASAAVRETLLARMRRVPDKTADDGWSFAREVTAHFGNLSPMMRGTFRNPEPGTPRGANPPGDQLKLGQKVEDLHDEVARANFRVVVIVPTEVDQTDLSNSEDPRRWLYRFVGAAADGEPADGAERSNGWEKVELWP